MDCLPTEVLERVLSYLDLDTIEFLDSVCVRWSDIIVRRHFHPHLAIQEYSVGKHLEREGWTPTCSDNRLITKLFRKVRQGLSVNWSSCKPVVKRKVVTEYFPGDLAGEMREEGVRVSDLLVYKDKLYLARDNCEVQVYNMETLARMYTLETGEDEEVNHLSRGCQLVRHNRTLACTSLGRDKVRLYNLDTDELVGQIETRLGPIYSLAINNRLLVCLSGWSCLSWRIDSNRPDTVRGQFRGLFPDFQPTDEFQNWLEIHSAVINSRWLVTRATRIMTDGTRSLSFVHCRQVGADGHIGPVLRQETAAMPDKVVEVTDMVLNDTNLLAILMVVKPDPSSEQIPGGPQQHVIEVTDISNGTIVSTLSSESLFSSVRMPVSWRGDWLFVKVVPKPFSAAEVGGQQQDNEDFHLSLGRWNVRSGQMENVAHAKVGSCNDLVSVEAARLTVVSTELTMSELEFDAVEEDFLPEIAPKFTTKVEVYNFWNVLVDARN